jgi:hypothetical protein
MRKAERHRHCQPVFRCRADSWPNDQESRKGPNGTKIKLKSNSYFGLFNRPVVKQTLAPVEFEPLLL